MYNSFLSYVRFKNETCFKGEQVGFDEIKPINVIVGKNNSGKSQLLNCLESYLKGKPSVNNYTEMLDFNRVKGSKKNSRLNEIDSLYIKSSELKSQGIFNPLPSFFEGIFSFDGTKIYKKKSGRLELVSEYLTYYDRIKHCITELRKDWTTSKIFRRINAERDILIEEDMTEPIAVEAISPKGDGITTILTQVYNLKNYKSVERNLREEILDAFNNILGKDAKFIRIDTKRIVSDSTSERSRWQIHLEQEKKGLVELDNSGSGLKTILLIIINIILFPKILKRPLSSFVFAFEELENNLHPALFRRLLHFISKKIIEDKSTLFLTTHSNIALDFFIQKRMRK